MEECLGNPQRELGVRYEVFMLDDMIHYPEIGEAKDTKWEHKTSGETVEWGKTTESELQLTVDWRTYFQPESS